MAIGDKTLEERQYHFGGVEAGVEYGLAICSIPVNSNK
jgi:hypothetical protein